MISGSNDQAKVLQFAAFRDHGSRRAAVYWIWPNILLA